MAEGDKSSWIAAQQKGVFVGRAEQHHVLPDCGGESDVTHLRGVANPVLNHLRGRIWILVDQLGQSNFGGPLALRQPFSICMRN